jgi:8-oxo-dGTP pyrophosphatase MutT (NUDIX family)
VNSRDPGKWLVLESQMVIETPYLRLRRDSIELPDGQRIHDYYVRESGGFAVIFAQRTDGRVVLVRQYKHGIGESVLELPAGAIEAGEDPADCARRELEEETGYVGSPPEPELVASFITDPTNSNSRFHLFFVREAEARVAPRPDPTEQIELVFATLDELREYLRDGTIEVNSHVASIYTMLDRLGRLSG